MICTTKNNGRSGSTRHWRIAIAAACAWGVSPVYATSYSEFVSGDLSNYPNSAACATDPTCTTGGPTNIGALTPGNNHIVGETIPSGAADPMTGARAVQDPDWVSFSVPTGFYLTQLHIAPDSSILPGDQLFFAIAAGDQVYLTGANGPSTGLLGYTLVDASMAAADRDLLPDLGASNPPGFGLTAFPGATTFSGPLAAGDYTLWILDGDRPVEPYDFDLVVAKVPEPAVWSLMAVGLIAAWRGRRVSSGFGRRSSGRALVPG